MTVQATIALDTLRCIQESDRGGSSHSEPYVWPFLAAVSNNSFVTTPTAAILSEARKVIKKEMRAGESAALTFPGNRLTASFEDDQTDRRLILIVALWEEDEAPLSAVQAGFQAYLDELKRTVGLKLLVLKEAIDTNDPGLLAETIDWIKEQVRAKVRSAIEGHLSWWDKVKIATGALNMDDFMATGFAYFSGPAPADFTLDFAGTAGDPRLVPVLGTNGVLTYRPQQVPIRYALEGSVTVEQVSPEPCQAQIDAIHAAEDALKGLQIMVRSLQQQIVHATPQQKSAIIATIRQINEERIPVAEAAIERARWTFRLCQIQGSVGPAEPAEPAAA